MKFNCGPSAYERAMARMKAQRAEERRLEQWRKVFLFWPKRMEDNLCHWLEFIETRSEFWDGPISGRRYESKYYRTIGSGIRGISG